MPPAPHPTRLPIALAASAIPALALSAASADPEVPTGAICDAVAPVVAGTQHDQDGGTGGADPTRSLAKARQIQGILGRIQQNGGLTGGASGDDINAVIRAVQSGDIGAAAAAGNDLANNVRPQITGEGADGESATGQGQEDSDPAAHPAAPLVDQGMLDAARNTVRQDCERVKASRVPSGTGQDDGAPAPPAPDETSGDDEGEAPSGSAPN